MQKEDLISVKDNGWTLVVENNNLFNNIENSVRCRVSEVFEGTVKVVPLKIKRNSPVIIPLESIMTIEKKGGKKK